ncbi:MAG: acyltransferase [Deltaproteobacteria bacterium]|nr:acyltransferase [Deltaproteobacteria bacterium]
MKSEILSWIEFFLSMIPGRGGRAIRSRYWRYRLKSSKGLLSVGQWIEIAAPENIALGGDCYLVDRAVIRAVNGQISIGSCFAMNGGARLVADHGEIRIGSHVMIGPNAVIRASNHVTERSDIPIWDQGQTGGFIEIGDDVWIGANAVIVPNVRIGSHSVIAAGAVVTRDVLSYSVVAGIPARRIKSRR